MRGRGLVASLLHAGRSSVVTPLLARRPSSCSRSATGSSGSRSSTTAVREQHRARLGVVLATGGFEWNAQMVRGFLGIPELTPASPPTGLGLGLGLALEAGAAISNMTNAWWDVVMHEPGQIYDGKPYYQTTTLWRGRAGTMMVNRHGRRFVNESMNYSDMGVIMKAFDPLAYEHPNMPSYILFDGGAARELPHRQPQPRHRRSRLADPRRHRRRAGRACRHRPRRASSSSSRSSTATPPGASTPSSTAARIPTTATAATPARRTPTCDRSSRPTT